MRLSLRSGGWGSEECDASALGESLSVETPLVKEEDEEEVEARNQLYMSLAPRLVIREREETRLERCGGSVENAARSAIRIAGFELMAPSRIIRRSPWSAKGGN